MHLQENTFFDLGVKVTQNVVQYPLHHVTYLGTKFQVAKSSGLGGDTFTKHVTDGPKKAGITIYISQTVHTWEPVVNLPAENENINS